ncbi:MAG: IS66 family transposase [Actinobacteria bacterium]|nr:IS66 family transposase [Actinomycetota bacterium]
MERAEAEAIYDAGRESCVTAILELAGRCKRLEDRMGRLEEQTRSSSRNSSKPPSSDPPKTRKERRAEARAKAKSWAKADREDAARRAGGQPGHRGSGRKLAPEDQVDEIVDHYPEACGGCGHEFAGSERVPSRRPGRHQVAELPPVAVVLTEHRCHRLCCPGCKSATRGVLPDEVAGSAFGPELRAAVVTMTARNRVSRRDMSELTRDLFGLKLSVGSVDAICRSASAVLAGPHEALAASVLGSGALNVDETGWHTAGEQRTLWTATTEHAAIFRVAEDRHRDRLEELIGGYDGIVCSDRWWAYDHLDPDCRQACWEHLKRDFRRHAEGLAEQQAFGEAGVALTGRLFKAWRTFSEHRDRRRLQREMAPIQSELRKLLERAARKSTRTRYHGRFARNLLKIWPALFTFVTVDGVEPTNNAAERSLRGPVIHRKTLPRHPHRRRRALRGTRAVRVNHLPPTRPLAIHLPRRAAHSPPPRRPTPHARLSGELNGYEDCAICRQFLFRTAERRVPEIMVSPVRFRASPLGFSQEMCSATLAPLGQSIGQGVAAKGHKWLALSGRRCQRVSARERGSASDRRRQAAARPRTV